MRFPHVLLIALALGGSMNAVGCKDRGAVSGAVDGPRAHELVKSGALLLDVRTPQEFSRGHIDGALNIPLSELDSHMGDLKKDQPIVVYCQSGNRSAHAQSALAAAGFTTYDLGGIYNW